MIELKNFSTFVRYFMRSIMVACLGTAIPLAHAEELPAIITGLKVEIENLPGAWKKTGWVSKDNEIYIIYSGNVYAENGDPIEFEIDLKFTAEDGHKIKSVGDEDFDPAVETYTEESVTLSVSDKKTLSFTLVDGSEQEVSGGVHLISAAIIPDHNRDGMINHQDYGKVTVEAPFRWWINSNNEEETNFNLRDLPEQEEPDCEDMTANGIRDLVDFFPLKLDISKLLEAFPAGDYKYVLSHPAGAFKFIEMPDLVPDSSPDGQGAGSYLRNEEVAPDAASKEGKPTTDSDGELSETFLEQAGDGNGVLLLEACSATQEPLELILKEGEEEKIRFALPVAADEIKKMYRWANLRAVTQGPVAEETNMAPPSNYPDNRASDKWFIFVHGYNVNESAARSWCASIFKRLYQSGSDAKFVGVTWYGDQGQLVLSSFGMSSRTPDFWRTVYNAFNTADALKTIVNSLSGNGDKIIAAHSLGNMVVCSAIEDKNMSVSKYFLMNAAVTTEAFDSKQAYQPVGVDVARMKMVHPDWKNATTWGIYDSKLYAAEYWRHFPATDGRHGLSWVGRFRKVATTSGLSVFNYWSSTETAATISDGSVPSAFEAFVGKGAWVKQEMEKGRAAQVLAAGGGTGNWSANGGWAFGSGNPLDPPAGPEPAATANNKTSVELRSTPFCKEFKEFNGQSIHGPLGDNAASSTASTNQNWLLPHDIPALSSPAGGTLIHALDEEQNANMTEFLTGPSLWVHSAMNELKYTETYKFFDHVVDQGNLND